MLMAQRILSTPPWRLSGRDLRTLMRRHRVTIRALARRMEIPMSRIRARRLQGIDDWNVIRDWVEAITGADPGAVPHPVHPGTRAETTAP
jgi:hypothetical protein